MLPQGYATLLQQQFVFMLGLFFFMTVSPFWLLKTTETQQRVHFYSIVGFIKTDTDIIYKSNSTSCELIVD